MTRICVISNSHVVALKQAWDVISSDFPDTTITFFAARKSQWRDGLTYVDGRLEAVGETLASQLAMTSGGWSGIVLHDYEAFLVYGFWPRHALEEKAEAYSTSFLRHVLLDRARKTDLYRQVVRLRSVTDKQIFTAQSPLLAPDENGGTAPLLMPYEAELSLLQTEVFDDLRCRLVPQPDITMLDQQATRINYIQGSQRLDVAGKAPTGPHADGERCHMNTEYGVIWLCTFLSRYGSEIASGIPSLPAASGEVTKRVAR
jgi:hypothetical protein